jgi:hypothetical protein
MNENQQNFDELKQLLKLKRHEVPPPGYFSGLSDQVISRIRAGEDSARESMAESLESQLPWLFNFLRLFEARPGMVGAFAGSLCLLLVLGVVFAEYSENPVKNGLTVAGTAIPDNNHSAVAALGMPGSPALALADSGGIMASTNPVTTLQPMANLFGQSAPNPLFQSAGFMPAR